MEFIKPTYLDKTGFILIVSNYYAPYAGVFLSSLINHSKPDETYDIIIFERKISEENKRLPLKLVGMCENFSLRFVDASAIMRTFIHDYLQLEKFYPIEVCIQVLAPFFVDGYSRLICIDTDTLPLRNIGELKKIPLDNHIIAAVPDAFLIGSLETDYIWRRMGITLKEYSQKVLHLNNPDKMINAGLIIFDCKMYCDMISIKEALKMIKSGKYIFLSQDILNCMLEGKIKFLNPAWNVLVAANDSSKMFVNAVLASEDKTFSCAYKNPYMLHWAGKPKPWVCPDAPYGSEWWEVAKETPFFAHIIARMVKDLDERQRYYMTNYGTKVDVWDPTPQNLNRIRVN